MSITLTIPTLTTDRLTLRAPQPADFDRYAAFRNGPRSQSVGGPFTRSQAFHQFCALTGHWQMRGFGRWIVADIETDVALGVVGLYHPDAWPEPEIGWTVFDDAEGRGIAREAALATRRHAYETLGWQTVMSGINAENTRSLALAARLGARYDGDFVDPQYGTIQIWRHPSPQETV
jgi:RimJ/RimL family protein N-acetyltransferase